MRIIHFPLLLIAFIVFSCENESLSPRINPQFGIALIQEVSASGVQFGATIYEFGSEPIIEYGFVFSPLGDPKLHNADFVRGTGTPERYFELEANSSLEKGRTYFVAAYLKTENATLYSKEVSFQSQGSEGFLVESVEWPLLFKGVEERVRIKGEKFSSIKSNYSAEINGIKMDVELIDSENFEIIIPEDFHLRIAGQNVPTAMKVRIAGKEFFGVYNSRFVEPSFDQAELKSLTFTDTFQIEGQNLLFAPIELTVDGVPRDIISIDSEKLTFQAYNVSNPPANSTKSPVISMKARGLSYELGKLYTLKAPEIDNTSVRLSKSSRLVLNGRNFIPSVVNFNNLIDQYGEKFGDLIGASPNQVQYGISLIPNRKLNLKIKNFDLYSNPVSVEITDPLIPLRKGPKEISNFSQKGIVISDMGYYINNTGLYELGFEYPFASKKVGDVPFPENYFFEKIDDKILIGGGAFSPLTIRKEIYLFDPKTKQLEQLSELPEGLLGFNVVYKVDNKLFFERGVRFEGSGQRTTQENWVLDLSSSSWTRLSDSSWGLNSIVRYFNHKNQLYSLLPDVQRGIITLGKKNFVTQEWEIVRENIGLRSGAFIHQPVQIGDFSYFIDEGGIDRLDLRSGEVDYFQVNTGNRLNSSSSFNLDEKAFLGVDFYLYEFDPSYLNK